jgi:hypothetical protein
MFWKEGRDYLAAFREAGLKDVEAIDARDLGHGVDAMFERHLPEILTTFINRTSGAPVGAPSIEPPGGVFAGSVQVKLTAPAPGIKLYYTTDGSDPAEHKQEYSGPVTLDRPCLLRVVGASADGKQITRQRLARFDVRIVPPSAEPGKNPGLAFEVVEGVRGKRPGEFLRAALDGKAKVTHQGTARSFAFPEEAGQELPAGTALFRGVLTVPETGVYRFKVVGSAAGLYLEDGEGKLVKLIENVGDLSLEAAIPLGKGGHRVLGVSICPQGREPFQILWRKSDGPFEPIPAGILSH